MRPVFARWARWFTSSTPKSVSKSNHDNANSTQVSIFGGTHDAAFETPGYFPPSVWSFQRPPNENLESRLFPKRSVDVVAKQISSGIAHLSGKPVDENLSYATYDKFVDLPLDYKLIHNISHLSIFELTPVQVHTIPLLLANPTEIKNFDNVGIYDLMAAAQTGSGKTIAYLLPLLHRIMCTYPSDSMTALVNSDYKVQFPSALILVPTRELVHQIRLEASKLCYRTNVRPVALYGGEKPNRQMLELRRGCHMIVATPGRLIDFLEQRLLNLSFCRNLIIDEADRLLDMGFEPQLRKIIESHKYGMPSNDGRQTALFSATFPPSVALLARDFLRGPRCISLNIVPNIKCSSADNLSTDELLVPAWGQAVKRVRRSGEDAFKHLRATVPKEILQEVEWVEEHNGRGFSENMIDRLVTILNSTTFNKDAREDSRPGTADCKPRFLIFCNTKREVEQIDRSLLKQSFKSVCIHGDRSQERRNHSVNLFRDGKANILVATSVVARGMDFPGLDAVINFGLPLGLDEYVHRIGRTGRMGRAGRAITLVGSNSIGANRHLQAVARGICRLSDNPLRFPKEFLHAAKWDLINTNEEEESDSFRPFHKVVPCPPQRLKNRYPKDKKPLLWRERKSGKGSV